CVECRHECRIVQPPVPQGLEIDAGAGGDFLRILAGHDPVHRPLLLRRGAAPASRRACAAAPRATPKAAVLVRMTPWRPLPEVPRSGRPTKEMESALMTWIEPPGRVSDGAYQYLT